MWSVFIITAFSQDIAITRGGCPSTEGFQTVCLFNPDRNCISQDQCPEEYRCCRYGCGSLCFAVADFLQHPGSCPVQLTSSGIACNQDAVCQPNEKCCNGHCIEVRPLVAYLVGRGPIEI